MLTFHSFSPATSSDTFPACLWGRPSRTGEFLCVLLQQLVLRYRSRRRSCGHSDGPHARRLFLHHSSVHSGILAGISGSKDAGCYSVVLSGGYEDDKDEGYRLCVSLVLATSTCFTERLVTRIVRTLAVEAATRRMARRYVAHLPCTVFACSLLSRPAKRGTSDLRPNMEELPQRVAPRFLAYQEACPCHKRIQVEL